jgi:Bacterial DNA-binding protein
MTKAEFVEHVAIIVQLPKHQIDAVLTRCLQGIMDVVHKGNIIELRGFALSAPSSPSAYRTQPTHGGHSPDAGQSCAGVHRGESLPNAGVTPTAPSRYADDVDARK